MGAFRHDPSIRLCTSGQHDRVDWDVEPVITALREFVYYNKTLDSTVRVSLSATQIIIEGVGLIVCSDDGYVRLLKLDLGAQFWELRLAAPIYSSPIYLRDKKTVVVCSTGGTVCAISLTGKALWRASLPCPVYAGSVYCEGIIFVATFNYNLYLLNADTGAIIRHCHLPPPRGAKINGLAAFRDPYGSPCIVDNNVVVVCGEHILCFSGAGDVIWSTALSALIKSSPAFSKTADCLLVASVDGKVTLLNPKSGSPVHEVVCAAKIIHSPAISGDIACIGDESGTIYGIDLKHYNVIWTYSVGAALGYSSVTLNPVGDFILVTERGNALCLSKEHGNFLWETSQNLQMENHERTMQTTPIISNQGDMYCGSYSGYLYRFNFLSLRASK
ncbi:PQQ-binding-like beta-propeller repeat protein [Pseudomonas syringae]|uniref:outer membrane protein assembly factor BamB family protein n=1 Tax=Pseudomonas syringae TaxID=317 RepID=UPI0011D0D627|nr:PQQ-binding-like beta-propeller repeat protein [Pseudomonas syringae]